MLSANLTACLALALAPSQGRSSETAAEHVALSVVEDWPAYVARDKRLTFGMRTAPSATRELDRADATDGHRSAAVLALGCAHVVTERPRIKALISEARGELRSAAVWALGALRSPGDVAELVDMTTRRPALAESAMFALALNGTPEALTVLSQAAAAEDGPLRAAARAGLDLLQTPPVDSDPARQYMDLRFEAARRHGLVDGQSWEMVLIDDLAHLPKFVGRVVYRAAAESRRPGVRDHFLEIVLAGGPPERLRGAVVAIPAELAQLFEAELYTPADDREWSTLLDEIGERRLESLTEPILRRAWVVPALRPQAALLLARGGAAGALQLLDVSLRSSDPLERRLAAEGLGGAGDESYFPNLAALVDDSEASVRAAALVARARLGSVDAMAALRATLGLDSEKSQALDADAPTYLEALLDVGTDPRLRPILRELLERVPRGLRLRTAAELVLGGDTDAKSVVREELSTTPPRGQLGVRAIAACARDMNQADLALLRELFPIGDDLDCDVELANALLRAKDSEVLPILRAALWTEPWNRSVLAGALWIDLVGVEGLALEGQRPPFGASHRDLRRVGFALGEWGGVAEVERLSARVSPADPVLQGAVLGALGARTH